MKKEKANYEIVPCGKCKGSGKFIYKSGIVGPCYGCNGSGKLKKIPHKSFSITIHDENGCPFRWLHVNARSKTEAERKARKIGENGCYKDRLDTIAAVEDGIEYTYKAL